MKAGKVKTPGYYWFFPDGMPGLGKGPVITEAFWINEKLSKMEFSFTGGDMCLEPSDMKGWLQGPIAPPENTGP